MPTREDVVRALSVVVDPEIGIDVVALGLVYGLDVRDGDVRVDLAMTSPTCPLSEYLVDTAARTIRRQVPDAGRIFVAIVDDPPWAPEMMSDDARRLLAGG